MNGIRHLLAVGLLLVSGAAFAAGTSTTTTTTADKGPYAEGLKAVEAEDWTAAAALFEQATEADPNDADAFNMLAYSLRQSGDIEGAFANYQKALAIDPEHKGAHEYIGEAYLLIGDLAGAEKHLEALDDICWLGCPEYRELKAAIDDFRASGS